MFYAQSVSAVVSGRSEREKMIVVMMMMMTQEEELGRKGGKIILIMAMVEGGDGQTERKAKMKRGEIRC